MAKLIVRRLLQAIPVLFVIITFTFFFIRLAPDYLFRAHLIQILIH